jgi:putative transcriptional regulator
LTKPFAMKNTIRIQRAVHQFTQQDLAEKIAVSRQTINAIESNKYVPSTILALKMAKLFKKNVDELFLLEETD